MRKRTPHAGFSLLELLGGIAIVGILAAVAVPSLARFMANTEVRGISSSLSVAVARARLRAVETGAMVSLCPRAGASRCRTDTDWSHGWLVFDDPRRRGQPSGPLAVREEEVLDGGQISIESTRGRRLLSFRSDGSSAGSNVTLSLCHPGHPGIGRQLIISNVGRLRSDDLPNAWACRPPS